MGATPHDHGVIQALFDGLKLVPVAFRGATSKSNRVGKPDVVAVGTDVFLGAAADIGELDARPLVDGNARGQAKEERLPIIAFCHPLPRDPAGLDILRHDLSRDS